MNRSDIFLSDLDRVRFLDLLGQTQEEYRWRVHSYTLMTNHYHFLVETPEMTLSRGMQQLDGDFAAAFNIHYRRSGPLFDGRFKSRLIEKETYLLEVSRYIVLNPVRAKMVETAGEWPWSSYRATAGLTSAPPWLETRTTLDYFDQWDKATAMRLYRDFVAAGNGSTRSPWEDLRAGVYLGSEAFIARVEAVTASFRKTATEPVLQRNVRAIDTSAIRQIIETHFRVSLNPKRWSNELARLAFARVARTEAIATFSAIAASLNVTPAGARNITRRAAQLEASDAKVRTAFDAVRVQIIHFKKRV